MIKQARSNIFGELTLIGNDKFSTVIFEPSSIYKAIKGSPGMTAQSELFSNKDHEKSAELGFNLWLAEFDRIRGEK